MQLREYLRHRLIGTRLGELALAARRHQLLIKHRRHPELYGVMIQEPMQVDRVVTQTLRDGDHAIDIGCHLGSILHEIVAASPTGQHLAVEPLPYKANWLRKRYPKVEVVQAALSTETSTAEFFFQPKSSGFSGLRNGQIDDVTTTPTKLTVDRKRLEDLVPEDRKIKLIKIDVEGAELDVFRGGARVLRDSRPTIIFECTRSALQTYEMTAADMFDALEQEFGYRVFTPADYLAEHDPLNRAAFVRATEYPFRAFNFVAVADPVPAGTHETPAENTPQLAPEPEREKAHAG